MVISAPKCHHFRPSNTSLADVKKPPESRDFSSEFEKDMEERQSASLQKNKTSVHRFAKICLILQELNVMNDLNVKNVKSVMIVENVMNVESVMHVENDINIMHVMNVKYESYPALLEVKVLITP